MPGLCCVSRNRAIRPSVGLRFIWDVLFGTARITRRYPEQFGVEYLPKVGWKQQLFWPLARGSSATMNAP